MRLSVYSASLTVDKSHPTLPFVYLDMTPWEGFEPSKIWHPSARSIS